MAGYLNKVMLIGNVGRDPEIRTTQEGSRIVTLSIATSESWRDKVTGERKEKTEWHRVVVMNDRIADVVDRFVKKGTRIYVEGQLQTRKWTDATGQDRYTTEVIIGRFRGELMIIDKLSDTSNPQPAAESETFASSESESHGFSGATLSDDDIPF